MTVHLRYKTSKIKRPITRIEKKEILDCHFSNISTNGIINFTNHSIEKNLYNQHISTINLATICGIRHNHRLKTIINDASLVVCDGKPIYWLSRIFKKDLPERITGIDLMERIIRNAAKKKHSVYFLGGRNIVINKVIEHYKNRYPKLNIEGFNQGFYKNEEEILDKIAVLRPNIIFIGMGCPKQEYIIEKMKSKNCINILVGVGGSFDVIAGSRRRAPLWVQNIGMEWFYRLVQEPRRLWKRYFFCAFLFIFNIFKETQKYFLGKISKPQRSLNERVFS